MTLAKGVRLDRRFEIGVRVHADDEGEDFTAKDLDRSVYTRVRLLSDLSLASARDSLESHVAALGALDAPGISRPYRAGVDPITGRVWFAEEWANGKPMYVVGQSSWDDAVEACRALATLLDPVRARGIVHGRLAPTAVLDNHGSLTLVGLAAGMWLGALRPRGPGGDLGQLGRWLTSTAPAPTAALRAWCAGCERGEFSSLAAALAELPGAGPTRAERAVERVAEDARLAEQQVRARAEAERQAREHHEAQIRTGMIAPPDLPAQIPAASWPSLVARVAQHHEAPYAITDDCLITAGLSWSIPPVLSASAAWTQMRALLQASRVLASNKPLGDAGIGMIAKLLENVATSLELERVRDSDGQGSGYGAVRTSSRDALMYQRGLLQDECIEAVNGTLRIGLLIDGWITSHIKGKVMDSLGSISLAAIPRDATAAAQFVGFALEAAASFEHWRRDVGGTCQYCNREFQGVDLHDATCCHGCAERHLGVIH